MSTASSDAVPESVPDVSAIKEPSDDKLPVVASSKVCSLCNHQLKHCDVVMLGKNGADQDIIVHPHCMTKGCDVKALTQIHVHVDEGKAISSAKKLIVQKRVKALYKAIAIANARKEQEAKQ